MRPGGPRIVVVTTAEPGIAGETRKRLVAGKPNAEVSQLHAGLASKTGKQLKVSVCLAVDVADDDQFLFLFCCA